MGRAIIGGVITSTLLTLVVVPVLYTYLDAWGVKAKAWFTRNAAADSAVTHGAHAANASAGGGSEPVLSDKRADL